MYKLMAFLVMACMTFIGCSTIDNISDENLVIGIHVASKTAAAQGLKLVFKNNPDKIEQIKADATKAYTLIRSNIVLVFQGASTDVVLRSAVDSALNELSSSLTPSTVDVIRLALAIVASKVELPANPTDQLSYRTRDSIAAFFRGVADGLEQAVKNAPTPTQVRSLLVWPE